MDDDPARAAQADRALTIALAFLTPAWLGAGLLDWYWHRVTKIERTSGARESLTHLAMLSEAGVPVIAATFFAIEPATVALMLAGAAAHQLTAMWDVAYASPRRKIAPREQHTHSFLEVIPYAGVTAVIALYPEAAIGIFQRDGARLNRRLAPRQNPLPLWLRAGLAFGIGGCVGLPYLEEFARCWRARKTLERWPIPEEPPITSAHRWAREHHAEGYES